MLLKAKVLILELALKNLPQVTLEEWVETTSMILISEQVPWAVANQKEINKIKEMTSHLILEVIPNNSLNHLPNLNQLEEGI